ncbi:hypothetical protein HMI56_004375 [Coelomomyces lativittatus]|nr:hypothetical protein HMI56_004375 [Coelomomyces lativittatus]
MNKFDEELGFTRLEKDLQAKCLKSNSTSWLLLFFKGTVICLVVVLTYIWSTFSFSFGLDTFHWHDSHFQKKKKNVIFMISDGFGPASETFGRTMYHVLCDNKTSAWGHPTPLDRLLIGTSRTRSASSWVTDSAAGMAKKFIHLFIYLFLPSGMDITLGCSYNIHI